MISGRFGEGLGGLFVDFGRLWEVQGVSWRRLREVFSTGWPPGGPREGSGINLASFWMDLGNIFGALGIIFNGFCDYFRETVNDKLKPGTDRTQDVN